MSIVARFEGRVTIPEFMSEFKWLPQNPASGQRAPCSRSQASIRFQPSEAASGR